MRADLDVPDFLERIGAWGKNREDGTNGLRLTGLLMFGRAEVIRDELPHYMLDYQERPEARRERRWVDPLVPDGNWSGNGYDFFRRVYQKLTADLKVPFQLKEGQRIEDTPLHESLRGTLVNTLIHADFSGGVPPAAVAEVEAQFGGRFSALPEPERLALVLTAAEGVLNHSRLRELSSHHPADITKRLARFVRDNMLAPDSIGCGTVYFLPWQVKGGFQPELAAPADAGLVWPPGPRRLWPRGSGPAAADRPAGEHHEAGTARGRARSRPPALRGALHRPAGAGRAAGPARHRRLGLAQAHSQSPGAGGPAAARSSPAQRPTSGLSDGTKERTNTFALTQKVWNFRHTLKDDGVGYGDHLEQLTYLLFLKMAHEYTQRPYSRAIQVPAGFDWAALRTKTGEPLEAQYLATLHKMGQEGGMAGAIFSKAQNKIQDPAKLARLVQMIDAKSWVGMDADTKGDLYECMLQKNAEDTKSGAGQYFTPRAVIRAMVECMQPEPMKTIADPACCTGGFFLGAYNWLTRPGQTLNKKQAAFLRQETFYGNEIVPGTRQAVPDEPVPARWVSYGNRVETKIVTQSRRQRPAASPPPA